jgi:HJR/Mrr/RecB family endonuclease
MMKNSDFDVIIEKSYLFLKERLKMDDVQAIVIISSVILLPITFFFGISYTQISQFELAFYITLGIDFLTIIYSIIKYKYFENKRLYFIEDFEKKIEKYSKIEVKNLIDLNKLNGYEFELFTREFYKLQGFDAIETKRSHDYGADVIAYKNNEKYIIQAKRFSFPVNYNAVYQADNAKIHYKADHAILFTNSDTNSRANETAKRYNVGIVNGHDIDLFLRKKQSVVIKNK